MGNNKKNQSIKVKLSFDQRDLILGKHQGGIPIAPLIDDNFQTALVKGKSVIVKMTADDIDDLLGFLALEANHTDDSFLEDMYDNLYAYLENILTEENKTSYL